MLRHVHQNAFSHQHGTGGKHIDRLFMLPEQRYMCPFLIYQDSFLTPGELQYENLPSVATLFVCIHKCESCIPVGFVLALSVSLRISAAVRLLASHCDCLAFS